MTLTLDLEIHFKVTALTFQISTIWLNYKSDQTKGRKNMQGQPFTEICFDLDLCLFSQALLKQKTDNEGFGQGFTE